MKNISLKMIWKIFIYFERISKEKDESKKSQQHRKRKKEGKKILRDKASKF